MKIVLITQNEPLFIKDSIKRLINKMPVEAKIVSCVLTKASPFGTKESFLMKAYKTYKIFGLYFFTRYAIIYMFNLINIKNSLKSFLQKNKIDIIELKEDINSKNTLELINSYQPDLLISIAGNQIFKKDLIDIPSKGCLNLHTALLPKYRGLMPTFWVLKNNEVYTGVSVFFVDEGIDSGPILVQKKIKIDNMSQNELIKTSKSIGIDAIIESIKIIIKDDINLIDNNEDEMTYFSFPTRADVIAFKKNGGRFF